MTRLYIAGPMTGLAEFNRPAFMDASVALQRAGFATLNPARRPPGWERAQYLRAGLADVLAAEGVAVLPDWIGSAGAWLEVGVARELGLTVMPVPDWIAWGPG